MGREGNNNSISKSNINKLLNQRGMIRIMLISSPMEMVKVSIIKMVQRINIIMKVGSKKRKDRVILFRNRRP